MPQNRPHRPKTRDGFEIAIICALTLEADAVIALFDHHWDEDNGPSFGKARGDPNSYSTGVIGCHNVVLAHLPGMGKVASGNIAAFCRMSFPNINLALVVGICGGAPSYDKGDIHLGDIIVSTGVVQYDFGRRFPDRFEMKDTLNECLGRPNLEIRSLLSKLTTARQSERFRAASSSYMDGLSVKYPGRSKDRLFPAEYRHMHRDPFACTICASCERETDPVCPEALKAGCKEIGCDFKHHRRYFETDQEEEEPSPMIHFGAFASGDTVMKSGKDRDHLIREKKVIGFEMESVGVWEVFPCVVIKSVCDYADSHKNKDWQEYTAACAAACAKAFLGYWDTTIQEVDRKTAEEELQELILNSLYFPEMNERKATVASETPSTLEWIFSDHSKDSHEYPSDGSSINSIEAVDGLSENDFDLEEIGEELEVMREKHRVTSSDVQTPEDGSNNDNSSMSPQRGKQRDNLVTWLTSNQPLYWISGKPGSGKSTLVKYLLSDSRTLEALKSWRKRVIILSHFFWKPGSSMQQSFKGLLCSLAYQLLSHSTIFLSYFRETATMFRKRSPSDWDQMDLCKLFYNYRDGSNLPICVFIDALDETAPGQDTLDLLQFIKALASPEIKICVSSRPERLFQLHFSEHPSLRMHELTKLDIVEYSETSLREAIILKPEGLDVSELAWQVSELADGIFLWAVLVTQSLIRGVNNGDTKNQLERRLNIMPKDLMDLYRDIVLRSAVDQHIYREYVSMAINLLFLAPTRIAIFPELTVFECMMTMEPGLLDKYIIQGDEIPERYLNKRSDSMRDLLNASCSGLLEVSPSGAVSFTHRSAKEFLVETREGRSLWEPCGIPRKELLVRSFEALLALSRISRSCNFGDFLRVVDHWRETQKISSTLCDSFLELTFASYTQGFVHPTRRDELYRQNPVARFLASTFSRGYHEFSMSRLHKLEEQERHDIVVYILLDECKYFLHGAEDRGLAFLYDVFEHICTPNWTMPTTNSNSSIGSIWFKILVSMLNWTMGVSFFIASTRDRPYDTMELLHAFLRAGANMATKFPIFLRADTPSNEEDRCLHLSKALKPDVGQWIDGTARFMIIEVNARALVNFISSWVNQTKDPAKWPNFSGPRAYMKVLAFGSPRSRRLYIVESESISARLIDNAKPALLFPATDNDTLVDFVTKALNRCYDCMGELRSLCRQTEKDYFWKGFRIWSPPHRSR